MKMLKHIQSLLLVTSLFFLNSSYAQEDQLLEAGHNIVIYAKVIYMEGYTNNVKLGVQENKSNYYRILLEIVDTNNICYKHIVVSYSGCLVLKEGNFYHFLISKRKTIPLYIEERKNDTVYKTNLASLPKRMSCDHGVLSNPSEYEYYFLVEKVW